MSFSKAGEISARSKSAGSVVFRRFSFEGVAACNDNFSEDEAGVLLALNALS